MYWTALKFKMFETCHYIINKRANKYKKKLGWNTLHFKAWWWWWWKKQRHQITTKIFHTNAIIAAYNYLPNELISFRWNEMKFKTVRCIVAQNFTYLFDWLEIVLDINAQFQHEPLEHCGHTSSLVCRENRAQGP